MGDKADSVSASSLEKKMKFKPKIPPRKTSKPVEAKMEVPDDRNNVIENELLESLKSTGVLGRRDSKVRRKPEQLQVAIGYEERSTARSFGIPRDSTERKLQEEKLQVAVGYEDRSTARSCGVHGASMDGSEHQEDDALVRKPKTKDVAPWDKDSYYPVTLKPDSSSETSVTDAEGLGLMESNEGARMLFFQLPTRLPLLEKKFSKAGMEKDVDRRNDLNEGCSFQELPAGYVGKMLVYKSGAVKLKLGDIPFEVTPSVDCNCPQDVAVINTKEKHCCILGNVESQRVVVSADVDALLKVNATAGSN